MFAIGYQCIFAYAVALILYQLGSVFGGHGTLNGTLAALVIAALIVYLPVRPSKKPDFVNGKTLKRKTTVS